MKKEEKIKRSHQLHLRLNDTEVEIFKNKAKNYKRMSSMIRDAVVQFNDQATKLRLESLNELTGLLKSESVELSKQGGNLNQVVKRANELIYAGELSQDYFDKVLFPTIKEVQDMIFNIKKQQSLIYKKLVKL